MAFPKVFAFLLAGAAVFSVAQIAMSSEAYNPVSVPPAQGPVYNPKSGSYFEWRKDWGGRELNQGSGSNWGTANRFASEKYYKGRRGRLAVIKDLETLKFIHEHFDITTYTWIGLRFFCKFRKLLWVNGELQPLKSPGMWSAQWYLYSDQCRHGGEYMGVFLTSEKDGGLFKAAGDAKFEPAYLVEYPAPPKETKSSSVTESGPKAN